MGYIRGWKGNAKGSAAGVRTTEVLFTEELGYLSWTCTNEPNILFVLSWFLCFLFSACERTEGLIQWPIK